MITHNSCCLLHQGQSTEGGHSEKTSALIKISQFGLHTSISSALRLDPLACKVFKHLAWASYSSAFRGTVSPDRVLNRLPFSSYGITPELGFFLKRKICIPGQVQNQHDPGERFLSPAFHWTVISISLEQ